MGQDARSRRERVKDEAAAWVVRLSDPDCPADQRRRFEHWRDADPEHEVAYEREAAAWDRLDRLKALSPGDARPDPDLLAPQPASAASRLARPRRAIPRLTRPMAAALVGAVGIGLAAAFGSIVTADPAYATAVGERRLVILDDGSRVDLNTDSEIRVRYRSGRREVLLVRGEAAFEVADDRRPFIVTTPDARFSAAASELAVRVRDEGASLVVGEGAVEATLLEGPDGGAPIRVAAGYGGLIRPGGGRIQPMDRVEAARTLAWRQGAVSFEGQSLAEAVEEFNRYNRRKMVVADPSISGLRLGGYFGAHDIDGFVRALRTTFPVQASTAPDGTVRLTRSTAA